MHLHELQKTIDTWIQTYGVRYFNELTNTVILTEEVGEFARLMARTYGEQSFKKPITRSEAKASIADELADILWVITCLANQMDIDLEEAMHSNLNKKNIRDKDRHINNEKL